MAGPRLLLLVSMLSVIFLGPVFGCGQKGDLYLPAEPQPQEAEEEGDQP